MGNLTIIKSQHEFDIAIKKVNNNGNQLKFTNHQFNCEVVLNSPDFVNLHNCIFKQQFTLRGSTAKDLIIKNCQFNEVADFTNFKFLKNARFHGCTFNEEVRFHNSKFM